MARRRRPARASAVRQATRKRAIGARGRSRASGDAATAPASAGDKPTFVFHGTVKRLHSSTLKDLTPDNRTIVVTVGQIIEAPQALAHLSGHDVTVGLGRGRMPKVNQELVFHTHGWIFGESVALQAIAHEAVHRGHTALLTRTADPVEQKRHRDLRDRFDRAHVVVSGRVAEVRLPAEARMTGRRAAAPDTRTTLRGPVSEHEPHWREAVIEVHGVHKGAHRPNEVVIRFPASTDVRWYKAPKFTPGHEGFFMLHRTAVSAARPNAAARRAGRAKAAAPVTAEVYTALSPMDFQSYLQRGGIRNLITGAPAAGS